MTPVFTARRKPKRQISSTNREPSPPDSHLNEDDEGPIVVRKPLAGARSKSKLRVSQVSTPTIQTPKAGSSNVTPEPISSTLLATSTSKVPTVTVSNPDVVGSHDRSVQIHPADLQLDITSKFGPQSTSSAPTGILNAQQIAERKARRARLAAESETALLSSNASSSNGQNNSITGNSDFVSLDAYDSDGEFKPSRLQVSSYLRDDARENEREFTRLVPEDEDGDIAEGFEMFTEADNDGKRGRLNLSNIMMGRETDKTRKEREAIRHLINRAEGASIHSDNDGSNNSEEDSEEDSVRDSDSDASASAAYASAQTRHGVSMSYLSSTQRRQLHRDAVRPRAPEKTVPIPTFATGLARLREIASQAEAEKRKAEIRLVEIETRLQEVEGEKHRIQRGLEEVGRELEAAGGRNKKEKERGLDDIGTAA